MIDPPQAQTAAGPVAVPLEAFADELLACYSEPLAATPTRQKIRQTIGQVMRLPGVATTADLTPEVVASWVRDMTDRALRRETIIGFLANLRAACNFAVRCGYLRANPVEARKHWLPHAYDGRPGPARAKPLTRDEVARLLTHLLRESATWDGHRLFALAATVIYAGLRRHEALGLAVADCDLEGGTLKIGRATLGRRARAMPPKLAEVLRQWLPRTGADWAFPGALSRRPWNGGPPGQKPLHRIRAAGLAVGIEGLSFERLREFWGAEKGRVMLPGFERRAPPARTDEGPPACKPGPKPKARTIVLELPARNLPPIIRGRAAVGWRPPIKLRKAADRLSDREFGILQAMIDAGCLDGVRLTEARLEELSGYPNPVRTLRDLRKLPPFKTLLLFPGHKGGAATGWPRSEIFLVFPSKATSERPCHRAIQALG